MTSRPNILIVISDQHNAKVLGHQGHPDVKTPHMDRLAAEGVRFDAAICQNPICTPSRVSLLSGQYCHNHGYYGLGGPRPAGLPTFLGQFRRAGYTTAAVGKIHCPEYWVEDDSDFFRESCPGWSIGGCPEYTAYLRERGVLADRDDMFYPENTGPAWLGIWDGRPSRLKYEDCVEAWTVRQTIGFMDRAKAGAKPFIAWCSLPRPHSNYCPSEPFWSMYDPARIALPPNARYDMALKAPHLRAKAREFASGQWTLFEPRTFEAGRLRKLRGYLGCVSQVDHALGQLLDWLKTAGLERDTIVVYTSDHGDYAVEHGIMEKAPGICADAITRVPFLWRWPGAGGVRAGHAVKEVVELVDLSATLCALAGVEALQTGDGRDLSAVLAGGTGDAARPGVTEFAWSKSLRIGQWRYVYYPPHFFAADCPDGDFGELYDLATDPWEMHNLYFQPRHAPRVQQMRRALMDWLVTTTRPATVQAMGRLTGDQAITRFSNSVNLDGKIDPRRLHKASDITRLYL